MLKLLIIIKKFIKHLEIILNRRKSIQKDQTRNVIQIIKM